MATDFTRFSRSLWVAVACVAMTCSWAAADLIDRGTSDEGYHLIYDDTLDVTWADYTFGYGGVQWGYDPSWPSYKHNLYWSTCEEWVGSLTITVDGQVFDDWRQPKVVPIGDYNCAYDGSTDWGWNITRPGSELAHLYHVTLNNNSRYNADGYYNSPYGLVNTGLFNDLHENLYWTRTGWPPNPGNQVFAFATYEGLQCPYSTQSGAQCYCMAVRDGDVAVPEPSVLVLLAGAAVCLVLLRKRNT